MPRRVNEVRNCPDWPGVMVEKIFLDSRLFFFLYNVISGDGWFDYVAAPHRRTSMNPLIGCTLADRCVGFRTGSLRGASGNVGPDWQL